jgi:archaemetzincin
VTVAVTAIGSVDEAVLAQVELCLRTQFRATCTRDALAEPAEAFHAARRQFSSPAFMQLLAKRAAETSGRVLGVTERDLFIPVLTFVFGQAQVAGTVALVSMARLRQEFYSLPRDDRLFSTRLNKEVAHETGHTLGLVHCPDKACVMSLSTAILHVDRKGVNFCDSCRRVLDERLAEMEKNEATLADSRRR